MEDNFDFLNDGEDTKEIDLGLDEISGEVPSASAVSEKEDAAAEEFNLDDILGGENSSADVPLDFDEGGEEKFFWETPQESQDGSQSDYSESGAAGENSGISAAETTKKPEETFETEDSAPVSDEPISMEPEPEDLEGRTCVCSTKAART